MDGSPSSSVTGGDEVYSDVGDPLHDNEVLDQLFYKQPVSIVPNIVDCTKYSWKFILPNTVGDLFYQI